MGAHRFPPGTDRFYWPRAAPSASARGCESRTACIPGKRRTRSGGTIVRLSRFEACSWWKHESNRRKAASGYKVGHDARLVILLGNVTALCGRRSQRWHSFLPRFGGIYLMNEGCPASEACGRRASLVPRSSQVVCRVGNWSARLLTAPRGDPSREPVANHFSGRVAQPGSCGDRSGRHPGRTTRFRQSSRRG
jgi:hypothetical protein